MESVGSPKTVKHSRIRGLILMAAFLNVPAHGQLSNNDIGKGTFAAGLNYPGLGFKYFLSDDYALEARGQGQDGDDVAGFRGYRYFRPDSRVFLFVGLEADYVRFRGAVGRGSGYGGEVFGGAEYIVAARVSVQADFGPAYVSLRDSATSVSADGIEYIMNVGINYYFEKGSGRQ